MRRNSNILLDVRINFPPNLNIELVDLLISLQARLGWCRGGTLHRSLHHTYNEAENSLQPSLGPDIEDFRTLDRAILSDMYKAKSIAVAVKTLRYRIHFVRPLSILPHYRQIGH